MSEPVEYLTVAEVAAVLRVSKMTVYRLVNTGYLEAARIGGPRGTIRIPKKAPGEYLASVTAGGPEPAEPEDP